jgi:hypothetical protein
LYQSDAKVTKVWNLRVPLTDNVAKYLNGVNASIWSLATARSIASSFQEQVVRNFSGYAKSQLREVIATSHSDNAMNLRHKHIEIRQLVEKRIDDIASSLGKQLKQMERFAAGDQTGVNFQEGQVCIPAKGLIIEILRSLFSFREGPLLDGPSMQPLQSYLLRSLFCKGGVETSLRIMQPVLRRLNIAAYLERFIAPTTDTECFTNSDLQNVSVLASTSLFNAVTTRVEAESTSLLADNVFLLDCGDTVVVRPGVVSLPSALMLAFSKSVVEAATVVEGRTWLPTIASNGIGKLGHLSRDLC